MVTFGSVANHDLSRLVFHYFNNYALFLPAFFFSFSLTNTLWLQCNWDFTRNNSCFSHQTRFSSSVDSFIFSNERRKRVRSFLIFKSDLFWKRERKKRRIKEGIAYLIEKISVSITVTSLFKARCIADFYIFPSIFFQNHSSLTAFNGNKFQ